MRLLRIKKSRRIARSKNIVDASVDLVLRTFLLECLVEQFIHGGRPAHPELLESRLPLRDDLELSLNESLIPSLLGLAAKSKD
jgi:hypothetical protein